MKGVWLKSMCMGGANCGWLVIVMPIIFFILTVGCAYEFRKNYLKKIKGRKFYHKKDSPDGYVIEDLFGLIFNAVAVLAFGAMMVTSIVIFK